MGGCHAPAAAPSSWSPRFPPGQFIPSGQRPACARPRTNSPRQPTLPALASPPCDSHMGWEMQTAAPGGLGSPGSAGCPQPAPARSPALLPPPGAVPSPVSPALSGARLFLSPGGQMLATKLETWDTAPEQGRGCLSFPPLGLGLCSQRSSRYRVQHMLKPQVAELRDTGGSAASGRGGERSCSAMEKVRGCSEGSLGTGWGRRSLAPIFALNCSLVGCKAGRQRPGEGQGSAGCSTSPERGRSWGSCWGLILPGAGTQPCSRAWIEPILPGSLMELEGVSSCEAALGQSCA